MLIHLLFENIGNDTAKLLPILFRQLSGFSGHSIKIRILVVVRCNGNARLVVACFLTKNGIFLIHPSGTSARILSAASLSLISAVESPTRISFCSFSVKSFSSILSYPFLFRLIQMSRRRRRLRWTPASNYLQWLWVLHIPDYTSFRPGAAEFVKGCVAAIVKINRRLPERNSLTA